MPCFLAIFGQISPLRKKLGLRRMEEDDVFKRPWCGVRKRKVASSCSKMFTVKNDNTIIENAIRPPAIGRKNILFIGAAEAGKKTAILYTIVESCRHR